MGITATTWFIVTLIVVAIAYDIFAVVKWGPLATISSVLFKASQIWPAIPFAFGVLLGHLFWPQ